jgi:hypothetical protein
VTQSESIERIIIAQCTASKRDERARAGDIYDESDYFRKQREYARDRGDLWFIQSAKHGLLHPDQKIEPYNQHAKNIDDAEAWAESIADDLEEHAAPGAIIEILGGKDYADPLTPELERRGYEVHEPLRGQGIGTRKASLKDMANRTLEGFA